MTLELVVRKVNPPVQIFNRIPKSLDPPKLSLPDETPSLPDLLNWYDV